MENECINTVLKEHQVGAKDIGTLSHELLHSWQEIHGTPSSSNYHNKEFRTKALGFGLNIDRSGFTQYCSGDTPFFLFLRKHGLNPPEITAPPTHIIKSRRIKLHLYECPCGVKARIGRSVFNAECLDCDGRFTRKD